MDFLVVSSFSTVLHKPIMNILHKPIMNIHEQVFEWTKTFICL